MFKATQPGAAAPVANHKHNSKQGRWADILIKQFINLCDFIHLVPRVSSSWSWCFFVLKKGCVNWSAESSNQLMVMILLAWSHTVCGSQQHMEDVFSPNLYRISSSSSGNLEYTVSQSFYKGLLVSCSWVKYLYSKTSVSSQMRGTADTTSTHLSLKKGCNYV